MKINLFVKGLLATTLAVLTFAPAAQAQFTIGIKAAATTNFVPKPIKEMFSTIPTLSATAGVFGEYRPVKFIGLRTELNAIWKGTTKHFWMKDDIDLFYVGAPILLEVIPIKNLVIGAGAEANFLVAAAGTAYSAQKKLDAGLVFHAEYRLMKHIGISLRYVHGLTKSNLVQSTDGQGNINSQFTANRTLQLGLSFSLDAGKNAKK